MKSVRLISTLSYYIVTAAGLLYLVVGLYAALALFMPSLGIYKELPNKSFEIYYPFTHKPFLLGDANAIYKGAMLSAITLYGIFFLLLGQVFNAFRKPKLFTPKNVARLSWFYKANLSVPAIALLITILLEGDVQDVTILACLHFIIGLFAYFMTAIFKEGTVLQEEQDLTL